MHQYARASLLVAAVLFIASCSDGDARLTPTQPTAIGTSSFTVSATAVNVVADPQTEEVCPPVTPSKVSFGVIVTPQGATDVTINRIRAQFTDTTGRQAPQVTLPALPATLPAPGPTATFGVPTGALGRTFPMTLDLGCSIGTRGMVLVIVDGSDGRGRRMSEQLTIPVRWGTPRTTRLTLIRTRPGCDASVWPQVQCYPWRVL